jgi:hypothetical protein
MMVMAVLGMGLLCLTACGDDGPPVPDVSQIDAPLQIVRFDEALFSVDTNDFRKEVLRLQDEYPDFMALYGENLMRVGPLDDPTPAQLDFLRGFVTAPAYRYTYDTTQLVYPTLEEEKAELQQVIRYFKYYFPDRPAPQRLTAFHAAFNYGAIIFGENELGVGLEYYLGSDFPYQRMDPTAPVFSDYLVRTYNRDHLVADLARVLVDDLAGQPPGSRLLDIMIHNGKKRYILDRLLPYTADTVKSEVRTAQWEWLVDNEYELYTFLKAEDLLYSSRYQDFRKLVEPSPTGAPVIPQEAPGEAANYLGFRMVEAYMRRHPELTMEDLLLRQDAQVILKESRYRPRD